MAIFTPGVGEGEEEREEENRDGELESASHSPYSRELSQKYIVSEVDLFYGQEKRDRLFGQREREKDVHRLTGRKRKV